MRRTLTTRIRERLRNGRLWRAWTWTRQARHFARHPPSRDALIVFLVPGFDVVSGGVMAILTHAVESERLREIHGGDVYVCSMPCHPPLMRFTRFKNDRTILDLRMVLSGAKRAKRVLLHVPEVHLREFVELGLPLIEGGGGTTFEFNVMLQNVDLLPDESLIHRLKRVGEVTVTTAHKAYAKSGGERLLGCRTWQWSVWVSPEQYVRRAYEEKENLVMLSPDPHPERERVISTLKAALPGYEMVVVKNLRYEDYKRLISRAKLSITFGEGLDGYFVESIFSGALGCAVYNERFFTPAYRGVPGVFESFSALESSLPEMIRTLNAVSFRALHERQFEVAARDYSYGIYAANLRNFYRDLFPHGGSDA